MVQAIRNTWLNFAAIFLSTLLLVRAVNSYSSSNRRLKRQRYQVLFKPTDCSRRELLTNLAVGAFGLSSFAQHCLAVNINVTPIAHTFITSGATVKPVRENDATRFLTNARVVYLIKGTPGANANSASEIVALTDKRKTEQGPGVTPGTIHVAGSRALTEYAASLGVQTISIKDTSAESVEKAVASLPVGDTLLVGPVMSSGVAVDGMLVRDAAQALGVAVGGDRSGGVLSVLLDGPRKDVTVEDGGYPISTLLWYSL